MGKTPVYSRHLKERFVDRGLHQRIPSGTEVFYMHLAKSGSMAAIDDQWGPLTTYLLGKHGFVE
jgi:hypothetical protein